MAKTGRGEKARVRAMVEKLKEKGFNITHQRMVIIEENAGTDEHPDAETIHRRVSGRLPTVSLDTVYRTLSLLEEKNLVSRVEIFSDRARYDANMNRHHHFVCTRCGLASDYNNKRLDNLKIPDDIKKFGNVESVHIQLRGVCTKCKA